MPIHVTCPGCFKRFQVSDRFAGQKGPCPNCKTIIHIPKKEEEVVIHAPEEFGPKDSSGRAVLKPIFRAETRFSWRMAVAIGGAALVVLVVALLLRSPERRVPMWILGTGAFLLGPPLAWAGYIVLRNADLEPYRGWSLWLRSALSGIAYAGLWALYAVFLYYVLDLAPNERPELFHLAWMIPLLWGLGALVAVGCFEFDFVTAVFHCGLYLATTVVLRMVMNLPPL
ncbi:MAG: hypothetical protein KatS3mg110_0845 [Pirellulaceae bacterium]|nr:MAG: hypothetical protein KatS3mg110_0845 [Pirellulaceae bacterium]